MPVTWWAVKFRRTDRCLPKLKKNLAVIISQYYAILLLQEVGGLARWGPAHKGRAGSTEYKQDGAQTEGAQAQHHTVPRAVE